MNHQPTLQSGGIGIKKEPLNSDAPRHGGSFSSPLLKSSAPVIPLRVDRLGLTLVYSPQTPEADLIFVHGLGGSSTRTWSWERNPQNFWPPWLGNDPEMKHSRIFTFGYNATLTGKYTSSGILDFAKDMLFRMNTYADDSTVDYGEIGEVCKM